MSDVPAGDAERVGDADRLAAVHVLTDVAAQGRLDVDDYEDRLARVYAAQTYDELEAVSVDLAVAGVRAGCRPAPASTVLALLSGFARRGRWNVPDRLRTVSVFGSGVIDLRYADFTASDIEITICAIAGGQTILVPPEVRLRVEGLGVMGAFEHTVSDDGVVTDGVPGGPRVTVRGVSLWGRVTVKRVKRRRTPTT